MIKLDINIGDTILVGRFKNKRIEVKEIGTDDHGLPTINGKSILKIRIEKLMKTKKNLKESAVDKKIQQRWDSWNLNQRMKFLNTTNLSTIAKQKASAVKYSELWNWWDQKIQDKLIDYIEQYNMERHHLDYLARTDQDDDPRESKQFKLSDTVKKNLKESAVDKKIQQRWDSWNLNQRMKFLNTTNLSTIAKQKASAVKYSELWNWWDQKIQDKLIDYIEQYNMERHHLDYLARTDQDDDPRESKQFKLSDTVKKILNEVRFNKDDDTYGFKYDEDQEYENLELSNGEVTVELYKDGSKWIEGRVIDGEKPYTWGSKTYQLYLSIDDICTWLRKDYGGSWELINAE